jgi:hypothetical protein
MVKNSGTSAWLKTMQTIGGRRASNRQPHCEITIADVLDMVSVRLGTNGITSGNA